MNNTNRYLVIMAGGSGTRFWPKSTSKRPKQLLSFGQGKSLLVQTLERFDSLVEAKNKIIVTTKSLSQVISEEAPSAEVMAEPQGRNTAPCIYWAARVIAERNPKAIMLVMPSDHYIPNLQAFSETIEEACNWASAHNDLVTLGIRPSRPETGYGYLKIGSKISSSGGPNKVSAFVEKPDYEHAEKYFKSGDYLWNGGMFLWRAELILSAFDSLMPEMKKAWDAANGDVQKAYPNLTATSIDYGIMEKAQNVVAFPLDCGWDDLGNWISLENLANDLGFNHEGSVVSGGEFIAVNAKGNIVDAPGKLVAVLGVDDLIIVHHQDAILVARKDRAQDIRSVVEKVKSTRPDLA